MKKLAIINDIHGNLEALKAIIPIIKELNVDYILSPGDLIGIGPSSNEVVSLVQTLPNFYATRGNHECYLLDNYHNKLSAFEASHHQFIKNQISSQNQKYLSTLPYEQHFYLEGLHLVMLHYARLDNHFTTILKHFNYDELDQRFKVDANIIIYGHEHEKSILQQDKIFINGGSCGCDNYHVGSATFIILTINEGRTTIQEYQVPYDITPEIDKMNRLNLPDKEFIQATFFKK